MSPARAPAAVVILLSTVLPLLALRQVNADEHPAVGSERIVLHTVGGDIVLALYPALAPRTVDYVLHLTRLGVYDTTHFSRVDPTALHMGAIDERQVFLSATQKEALRSIPEEFTEAIEHQPGTVSMPAGETPNSTGGSFSIALTDAPE